MSLSVKKEFVFGFIPLISAGLLFGSIPVIAAFLRDFGASTSEQVLLRLFFGLIFSMLMIIFFLLKQRETITITMGPKFQRFFLIQGIIYAMMIITYISSIVFGTPVGEAALLVQIQPFFTIIMSRIALKEKITIQKIIAFALAILGIVVITEPWNWDSFLSSIIGDLFALSNGLLYSLYLLVGKISAKSRAEKEVSSLVSISWVLIWGFISGCLMILLLYFVFPSQQSLTKIDLSLMLSYKITLLGFALALFGSLLPYLFIMIAGKFVEASKTAIIVLVEPIGAIIFGAVLLQEPITLAYILGGLAILIAVIITTIERKAKREEEVN